MLVRRDVTGPLRNKTKPAHYSDATSPDLWGTRRNLHANCYSDATSPDVWGTRGNLHAVQTQRHWTMVVCCGQPAMSGNKKMASLAGAWTALLAGDVTTVLSVCRLAVRPPTRLSGSLLSACYIQDSISAGFYFFAPHYIALPTRARTHTHTHTHARARARHRKS